MENNRLQTLLDLQQNNPNDSFINYALAKEYESLENYEMAENKYREIMQKDPDYVGMYYHFGKMLWTLMRDAESVTILDQGIEVAERIGDKHALGELRQLRWEVGDEDM